MMSESIGRWSVGKNRGFTIYQGVLLMKYTIREPTGAKLEVFHDNTVTKMYKETAITARKIQIRMYSDGDVEGTYELDNEDMTKHGNWYTIGAEISEIVQGDDSGVEIYRICGPEKPKCEQHKTEECNECDIKKEDYDINVLVAGHGKNEYQLRHNETTDGSGAKITVKRNKGPLRLDGKIFSCKTS